MKTLSIILTTACAGLAGAVVGTLFAPNKGAKTRKKISKKGSGYKDYFQDKF